MCDIFVLKTPHHMNQSLYLPEKKKKTVSQPLTPAGTLDETGDVGELYSGGSYLFRIEYFF
jgi:hypothetical protein